MHLNLQYSMVDSYYYLLLHSGKSLIIYMLCRWFEGEMSLPNCKTVIIVPTTSLVEQMTKDFQEYGYKRKSVRYISGQEVFDAPITVTTWQSFAKST